jgi:hypothetical protein
MHNIIIKNKNNAGLGDYFDATTIPITGGLTIDKYTHENRKIENANVHYKLHNDLIEHLWDLKNNKYNESVNFVIYQLLLLIKLYNILKFHNYAI